MPDSDEHLTDGQLDARLDARLRAAGELFRAATQTAPPAHAPSELLVRTAPAPHRLRWITVASAAVVAAALVIGAVFALRGHDSRQAPAATGLASLQGVVWTNAEGSLAFVGDLVRVVDGGCSYQSRVAATRSSIEVSGRSGRAYGAVGKSGRPLACGSAKTAFAQVITGALDYRRSPDRLVLSKPGLAPVTLSNSNSRPIELAGTSWRVEVGADQQGRDLIELGDSAGLHIEADGTFTANDGCNALSGRVTASGTGLSFGPVTSTALGCVDPELKRSASAIDQMLSGDTQWQIIDEDQLALGKPGAKGYVWFEQLNQDDDAAAVIDKDWTLTTIKGGSGRYANGTEPAGAVSLRMTGSTFAVTGECTSGQGDLVVGEGSLSFALRKGNSCMAPESSVTQAAEVVNGVLDGGTTFTVAGSTLRITNDKGALVFTSGSASALTSHVWQLSMTEKTSGNGNSGGGSASPAVGTSNVTFATDGTVTIAHLCFANSGSYLVSGDQLTAVDLQMTGSPPCPTGAVSAAEQAENVVVDSILSDADGSARWHVSDGMLTISKDGATAVFRAPTPGRLAPGSAWDLETIDNAGTSKPVAPEVIFTFGADTLLVGDRTVCHDEAAGGALVVAGCASAKTRTRSDLSASDSAFVFDTILRGTVKYAIRGDELTITNGKIGELTFVRD